jgi:hypothetical protein
MTATEEVPVRTAPIQSGLAVAFPTDYDAAAIRAQCGRLAGLCDELVDAADPRSGVVCTFAFESEAGPAGIVVRRLPGDSLGDRLDLRTLLGLPIAGVVRLDAIVRADAPDTLVRVERLLVAIAATLCGRLAGIACDDLGAVYAADELARLASAERTIVESETFRARLAALAAIRDGSVRTRDVASDVAEPSVLPADALPDISTERAVGFVVVTERLPLMIATRILLATRGVSGGNPGRLPVVVLAPFLPAIDRSALFDIGVRCADDVASFAAALADSATAASSAPPVRATRERDEFCIFFSSDVSANVDDLMNRRALDVALGASAGIGDGPVLVETDFSDAPSDLPYAIARFGFDGALASFYRARVRSLDPFLRRVVEARGDVTAMFEGPAEYAAICELVADPAVSSRKRQVALERADAYAVSIASEVASDAAVVTDGTGAIYGATELARLTGTRRGRSAAWSRRVALVELADS